MPRYFLQIQYNGTAFHGSQIQGELPTVQYAINKALSTLLRSNILTLGASRTDESVHALCNYFQFDYDEIITQKILYSLNSILPKDIAVNAIFICKNNTSNARFDALRRTYRYRIYQTKNPFLYNYALHYPYNLDLGSLNKMAEIVKSYTDFETFSKKNTQNKTTICTIFQSEWRKVDNELHYVVSGNRFLRGMVRGLVGTQINNARKSNSIEHLKSIIESKNCANADFSVPGYGLYLENIEYPNDYFE